MPTIDQDCSQDDRKLHQSCTPGQIDGVPKSFTCSPRKTPVPGRIGQRIALDPGTLDVIDTETI